MRPTLIVAAVLVAVPLVAAAPAQAAPGVLFTTAQYDSPGADTQTNSQLNKEYIVVKNFGKATRVLTGWSVSDITGYTYKFPAFRLKPGKSVVIRTGQGTNTATTRYFQKKWYVWNNTTDTAYLKDKTGRRIDTCTWKTTDDSPFAC